MERSGISLQRSNRGAQPGVLSQISICDRRRIICPPDTISVPAMFPWSCWLIDFIVAVPISSLETVLRVPGSNQFWMVQWSLSNGADVFVATFRNCHSTTTQLFSPSLQDTRTTTNHFSCERIARESIASFELIY
jgi:hypothetical protein